MAKAEEATSAPPREWLEDANGNKCSIAYFGSEEVAQKALDSLVDCKNCINCSGEQGDFVPPVVPKIENIHTRVFEAASQPKALNMSDWHTCGTTHCRAGWVVHLAGEAGYALERFHGTPLAAQLICRESDPANPVSPVRFYETNEQALADMKWLAEAEAA